MSDAPTVTMPALGDAAAATCRACAAPLAPDQRYCLNCGARIAAPRVEWQPLLGDAAARAGAAPAAGAARPAPRLGALLDRVGGPMGAAAVILVALGVGFLLGQGGGAGGPATVIQRPPVINVQGGGTAAEATGTADATGEAAGRRARRGRDGAASTEGIPTATEDDAGGDLERLQQQPTQQATEGAPPRPDDRPSGGGTEAETIG